VEDRDPLKQLQSFIDDRSQVLEKISSIQSVLQAIRSAGLASSETEPATTSPAENHPRPDARERPYDLVLTTLRDMRAQVEGRLRPLAEEILRAEETWLRDRYGREHQRLQECAERIDQCILDCRERIDEYEKGRAELARLNQRLVALGADPVPLPESLGTDHIASVISERFNALRRQSKL
jgi:hypothetical protein